MPGKKGRPPLPYQRVTMSCRVRAGYQDKMRALCLRRGVSIGALLEYWIDCEIGASPTKKTSAIMNVPTEKQIQTVYQHYLKVAGKSELVYKLTEKRRKKIKARLVEFGKIVEDPEQALCMAIDELHRSPFHMGQNDRGEIYNDLDQHILRSYEQAEKWLTKGKTYEQQEKKD